MFRIIVTGDYALFTRPETKVERVTYPVPTPSALIGLLKSVYWKPAIRYTIHKIVVFNEIQYVSVRRNEVKDKVSESAVKNQMKGGEADPCIYTKASISQRAALLLKNVKYGVEFSFDLTGICSEREENSDEKHACIIRRRLKNGQYFRSPCMGCAEFPVKSIELVEEFDLSQVDDSLKGNVNPGRMLYGMNYHDDERKKKEWKKEYFSDNADPEFYCPVMVDGVIDVDKYRGNFSC